MIPLSSHALAECKFFKLMRILTTSESYLHHPELLDNPRKPRSSSKGRSVRLDSTNCKSNNSSNARSARTAPPPPTKELRHQRLSHFVPPLLRIFKVRAYPAYNASKIEQNQTLKGIRYSVAYGCVGLPAVELLALSGAWCICVRRLSEDRSGLLRHQRRKG
jgi:hypothetical protein